MVKKENDDVREQKTCYEENTTNIKEEDKDSLITQESQDQPYLNDKQDNVFSEEGGTVLESQTATKEQEEVEVLKKKLEEKEKEVEEYKNLCQRVAADFDNYKKRIAKDKENMYFDVVADVVGKLLPIVDNFERAINSAKDNAKENDEFLKGLEMIKKQIDEIFSKLGVEPIEALNKEFDPYLHNAIMHVEDERYGKNIVIEELQKGYKIKDRVIRYSLVKVANAN